MARIIPFYIPARHRKQARWASPQTHGKVLSFRRPAKKAPDNDWRILGITGQRSSHFKIPSA